MTVYGKLFVFEGADGVGKTTIAKKLVNCLQKNNIPCMYFAFPGRSEGTLGHHIYELHHNRTEINVSNVNATSLQALHIAAHIDAIENHILPTLAGGTSVVLDRYWWSTLVYGEMLGANSESLRKLIDAELIHWTERQPDQIFLVTRDQPIDRQHTSMWDDLILAYLALACENQHETSVYQLRNTGPLDEALEQVYRCVEKIYNIQISCSAGNCRSQQTKLHEADSDAAEDESVSSTPAPPIFSSLLPAIPTEVYDSYWSLAAERQEIFFRRFEGKLPPWTDDTILRKYKFTNSYRASDRVSQYLIRNVIYQGPQSPVELFFRILLFKIFNRISTWELLQEHIGEICFEEYSYNRYDSILSEAMQSGQTIFSAAYIMPPGRRSFGENKKHRNFLKLLEKMIREDLPYRIAEARHMRDAFELLRSYPLIGDFLAYQYVIDLNYSTLTDFEEREFVIPGPGAKSGILKSFRTTGGLNDADIIRMVADRQEFEFKKRGLPFRTLWGRPLQLVDCQNLFCEVDKYSRVAFPKIQGTTKRSRIKQTFHANSRQINYWYPPKWGINTQLTEERARNNGN